MQRQQRTKEQLDVIRQGQSGRRSTYVFVRRVSHVLLAAAGRPGQKRCRIALRKLKRESNVRSMAKRRLPLSPYQRLITLRNVSSASTSASVAAVCLALSKA
eukprot:3003361-Pleurochrysis_carterae.AAC.1